MYDSTIVDSFDIIIYALTDLSIDMPVSCYLVWEGQVAWG